jgi:hypothetical protein
MESTTIKIDEGSTFVPTDGFKFPVYKRAKYAGERVYEFQQLTTSSPNHHSKMESARTIRGADAF